MKAVQWKQLKLIIIISMNEISRELKDQIKEREKLYINSVKHRLEANIKYIKSFVMKCSLTSVERPKITIMSNLK